MTKAYYTYRIRIPNNERVQVEKWDTQHRSLGEPVGVFSYKYKFEKIAEFLQTTQNNELKNSYQVRELGETLFNILFDNVLRQDFVNFYYQVVQDKKQLLRVELDIDEQGIPEVAALPWEFMCLPMQANLGEIWLSTDPNLIFARRRSQWLAAPSIQLEPDEKLKIALVVSAPTESPELGPVIYDKVQIVLERLVKAQPKRVELLPIVNPATPEAIDKILEKKPHIFHFIGHGRLQNENQEEVGQIALVDDMFNEALWVDANYFSGLFNRHHPGVVMLQACEGGMLSTSQAFVGVASRVVQQNIPVVVAMQYEVSNITASRFCYRFYECLAKDDPVDIAAQEGRRTIILHTQYQKRDFATPVIFMRVEDGYLFKRQGVDVEPNREISQSLQDEYNSRSVRRGLDALTELMSAPEVRDAVVIFRNDFQAACQQIDVLADYKDLHDLLHMLEFQCYGGIFQEAKRFSNDETALNILTAHEMTLQQIVNDVQEVVVRANLAVNEIAWVNDLAQAQEELRGAIEESATRRLQKCVWLINRVLAIQPTRINTSLNNAARTLRLPSLVKAMTCIRDTLANSELNRQKESQFQKGVDALASLNHSLTVLLKNHNDWQEVDLELRRIEASLERDTFDLEMSWPDLKIRTESLYNSSKEDWALSFKNESENLNRAIVNKEPGKIKQFFRSYRSRAGNRFNRVDKDLKKLCGNLRIVGEPLASVLGMIE